MALKTLISRLPWDYYQEEHLMTAYVSGPKRIVLRNVTKGGLYTIQGNDEYQVKRIYKELNRVE